MNAEEGPFDFQAHRTRLGGGVFEDFDLRNLDLRGAYAERSVWVGCTFDRVRLSHGAFGLAAFEGCVFRGCDLSDAALVSVINRTAFERCQFDFALLRGADVQDSSFSGRAQFSDWSNASLRRTRVDLDLRAATLNFAITDAVDFRGSNFWSAVVAMNCATLRGNVFDERQVQCFLSLLLESRSAESVLAPVRAAVKPKWRSLIDRLVNPKPRARKLVAKVS